MFCRFEGVGHTLTHPVLSITKVSPTCLISVGLSYNDTVHIVQNLGIKQIIEHYKKNKKVAKNDFQIFTVLILYECEYDHSRFVKNVLRGKKRSIFCWA